MSKIFIIAAMLIFLASCVVVHGPHVPPGQIKRVVAPGHMKRF